MNLLFQHKYIHTYTWSARNSKTVVGYITANGKLLEEFLDVIV